MSDPSSKLVEVGVVLQGGGALGAYECGALEALLDLMDGYTMTGRKLALKVVAGVSIGAFNAACVVGSTSHTDARQRLDAMWNDLTVDAPSFWSPAAQRDFAYFGLRSFYMPRFDLWAWPSWTYFYDTKPMLATLARHVNFDVLNASPVAYVATAVEVASGRVQVFSNKTLCDVPAIRIEPHHVMASGSLPPGFPWAEINGVHYWDGGIVDNTPLSIAIDAFSDDADADRMLVVINLYPLRARLPRNLAEVQDRVHELSYGNRMRQDHDMARRINALVETIEELVAKIPPDDVSDWLEARLHEARRYKIIDAIVNIDMQDPTVTLIPGEQNPADDADGIRDFSVASVTRRRQDGYKFARAVLEPAFENRWRKPVPASPTVAAAVGS